MNLAKELPNVTQQAVISESLALAHWYDSQPVVRRLWGIRRQDLLRVIVAIEPTLDNDDIYPAWLANTSSWRRDLHARLGRPVQLELFLMSPWDEVKVEPGCVVIADLHWRDATL